MENLLFEKIILHYHRYVEGLSLTPEMALKHEHSKNVAQIADRISEFVMPSEDQRQLTRIAALYHDIGRYEQFQKYGTFNDYTSEDHGTLGAQIIEENKFFDELSAEDRDNLLEVIKNHNKKSIALHLSAAATIICNVVRDADKIDILYLLASHYQTGKYDPILSLGLPDVPSHNPLIINDLMSATPCDFHLMQSLNDFKLLNLSWVYDINFAVSYALLYQQKSLEKIYHSLTVKAPEIDVAYQMVDGICEAYAH